MTDQPPSKSWSKQRLGKGTREDIENYTALAMPNSGSLEPKIKSEFLVISKEPSVESSRSYVSNQKPLSPYLAAQEVRRKSIIKRDIRRQSQLLGELESSRSANAISLMFSQAS